LLGFIFNITWSFSYGYARHKIDNRKNGPALQAISMAMRIRRYSAERIPQYGKCKATPRCHWTLPLGKYLPCIAPADAMVIDFGVKNQVAVLWKSLSEASIQRHETYPLLSLSKQQAA
jgi:hypothetical protein